MGGIFSFHVNSRKLQIFNQNYRNFEDFNNNFNFLVDFHIILLIIFTISAIRIN